MSYRCDYFCKCCSAAIPRPDSVCPRCGYNNRANTMEAVLTEMMCQIGQKEFCRHSEMVYIFEDLAPELEDEQQLLRYLYEVDGTEELLKAARQPPEEAQARVDMVLSRLKSKHISEKAARAACQGFLSALENSRLAQNRCGERARWELANGVLTISGSGAMGEYGLLYPWRGQRGSIKAVVIKDGITSIGSLAFADFKKLTDTMLPNSVREIGDYAFAYCLSLPCLIVPCGVTKIGSGVFYGCSSLKSIMIPDSVTEIEADAFSGCDKLTIHAPEESSARSCAQKSGIPFEAG